VRYVLEGSVQRDRNRVRVNAQLIDGQTATHLWADQFDMAPTDLLQMQDEIVARLAYNLGYEFEKAEAHSTLLSKSAPMLRIWRCSAGLPSEKWDISARKPKQDIVSANRR
jgi:hypothetical protein